MHRLRQRRPDGRKRLADLFECLNSALVRRIVTIEERNERTGVNEYGADGAEARHGVSS
jgi:hypothetical protein